jgi:cell division protease FtsH
VLGLLALNWLSLLLAAPSGQPRVTIPFSTFLGDLHAGEVRSISTAADSVQGDFKHKLRYPPSSKTATATTLFATQVPAFWSDAQLTAQLEAQNVEVKASTSGQSVLVELLLGFGPTILFVGLLIWGFRAMSRAGGGMGALGAFGRSRARLVDAQSIPVTFADVAGIDEAKSELSEIVDFLRDPTRYTRLGGRMPHGVLLSGPPGTGRACATCSRRPAQRSPRSSSSTSSTRSADRARDRSR